MGSANVVSPAGPVRGNRRVALVRKFFLSRPFEESSPYKKLGDVSQSDSGFLSKITVGQMLGTGLSLLGGICVALVPFAQDKAKWLYSTVFNFIFAVPALLLGSVGRKAFIGSENNRLINKLVPKERDGSWDDLVLNEEDKKLSIEEHANDVFRKGVVIDLRGPIGSGKTFAATHLSGYLEEKNKNEGVKVVTYQMDPDLIKKSISDMGPSEVLGIKLGDGSIAEKLEGILAHFAEEHRKSNGKKIFIIVANEGHDLLGSSSGGYSPYSRESVHEELAHLFDRQNQNSFRSSNGAGVIFVVTHNASRDNLQEHLNDRIDCDVYMDNLDSDHRKIYIGKQVSKFLNNKKNTSSSLTQLQIDELSTLCEKSSDNGLSRSNRGNSSIFTNRKISEIIENVIENFTPSTNGNNSQELFSSLENRFNREKQSFET